MDLLLIFPPFSVNERYAANVGHVGGHLPPLGIAAVAAYLESRGFVPGLLDAAAEGIGVEAIVSRVGALAPLAVGISSLTPTFPRAVATARAIRGTFPGLPVILGGHHASIAPEEVLAAHDCFDIVVHGEGELTAAALLEIIRAHGGAVPPPEALAPVAGIAFRDRGRVVLNPCPPPIADLDTLPFPARHLLPCAGYLPLPNQYRRPPVCSLIATRGCPFRCTFCSYSAVFGHQIRFRSPGNIVAEIRHLVDAYGAREIAFWDDTLTVNRSWLLELCKLIDAEGRGVIWSCYGRVDRVDEELLRAMKQAGCWSIFYGIESGSELLLRIINKGITLDHARRAVRWTKAAGIETRASFMLCLPGETPALAEETIRFALELDPDYAQFSLTTPYPGTELYRTAKQYGTLDETWENYHGWYPVFLPAGYRDREEAIRVYKSAFRHFYLRPRYVWGRLRSISSLEDVKRYAKGLRMILGMVT